MQRSGGANTMCGRGHTPCAWARPCWLLALLVCVLGEVGGVRAADATMSPSPAREPLKVGLSCVDSFNDRSNNGGCEDIEGFAREWIEAIARKIGREPLWIDVHAMTIRDALASDTVEVVAVTRNQPELLPHVELSEPYLVTHGTAFRLANTPPGSNPQVLRCARVGIIHGGLAERWCGVQGIVPTLYGDLPTLYAALSAGQIDYLVTTLMQHRVAKEKVPNIRWELIEPGGYARSYAFGCHEDDHTLSLELAQAAAVLDHDGTYDRLYERWLAKLDPMNRPSLVSTRVLAWTLGIAGSLGLAALFWHLTLRRSLANRTAELIESEGLYGAIFHNTLDAVVLVDPRARRVIECNAAACRIYGYTREEFLGLDVDKMTTDPVGCRAAMSELSHTGHGCMPCTREFRKDGSMFDAEIASSLVRHQGRTLALCVIRDISERLEEQRRREELQGRFRRIVEASIDAMMVYDPSDQRVLMSNDACVQVYGYSRQELADFTLDRLPVDPRVCAASQQRILAEGSAREVRTVHRHRDGHEIDIEYSAVTSEWEGRRVIISVLRDITTRLSEQRQREDLQRRLHQAEKLESLGVLAGGMAHDFNNLLLTIRGNAELAREQTPDHAPAAAGLDRVLLAADHAAELTTRLLSSTGRDHFAPAPTDLAALVHEQMELLRSRAGPMTTLTQLHEPNTPIVRGDRSVLRQIVLNLLTNALDALPNRIGSVRVRTAPDGPPGATGVLLEVTDSGVGMDAACIAKIFEPFYTTKFTGRGLGMSIVRAGVQRHAGTIDIESTPGRGTSVRVRLPSTSLPTPEPTAHARTKRLSAGLSVLVIDDDAPVREVTERLLRSIGCEVQIAQSGAEGIERITAAERPFDAVLLDLVMPGTHGADVLREIKRRNPAQRVVVMSGYSADLIAAAAHPPDAYLTKPFTAENLVEAIGG